MRTAGITCRTQEPLGVDRDVSSNWNGADDAAAVRGQKGRKKAGYEQAVSNQKHGKGFFTRTQKKKKKDTRKNKRSNAGCRVLYHPGRMYKIRLESDVNIKRRLYFRTERYTPVGRYIQIKNPSRTGRPFSDKLTCNYRRVRFCCCYYLRTNATF